MLWDAMNKNETWRGKETEEEEETREWRKIGGRKYE